MLQQQLRPKQHIGRSGVWGDHGIAQNYTELHGNEGMCPNTIREKWKKRKINKTQKT